MGNISRFAAFAALALSAVFAGAEHKKFFAYRSFWPEFKAMGEFAKQGVNLYAIMPSNAYNSLGEPYCKYPPVWPWKGVYDWDILDSQFDDVIKVNPNARFICLIDLNSPLWLAKDIDHQYGIGGDSYNSISNSACTKAWLEPTEKYLRDFVEHTEKKYGGRIDSYIVAAGGTSEWYDCSNYVANLEKIRSWHKWRKARGLPEADVPTLPSMNEFAFAKRIRDPKTQRIQMDYVEFTSETVVGLQKKFAKIVRKIVGDKKEIGSFSGYITASSLGRYDSELTYNNTDVDFFGAPPVYDATRAVGKGGSFQALRGSSMVAGKGWFQEIDHRTHTYNSQLTKYVKIKDYSNAKNQAETDAVLKREFAISSIYHCSLWCFDMWGGVFSTPETMKLVGQSRKIWERFKDDKSPLESQIAVVVDPRSQMYSNFLYFQDFRRALTGAGLSFECFSFGDLAKIDLSKYKLVAFPATFEITPEREKFLREKVFCDGRTVLFVDAFSISDGKDLDVSRVKKYTGFDFDTAGASNRKDMGGWTSLYFKWGTVNPKAARKFAREAGVHFYVDGDPAESNGRLLFVHSKEGGKKTVSLLSKAKKVVELYSGKIVAENTDKFEYDFKSPDTALFEIIK